MACETTPLGVEQYNWGFGGVVSPRWGMGRSPSAFGYFALPGLKQGVFKDIKMVFNYIILANFNKTDTVYVVLL